MFPRCECDCRWYKSNLFSDDLLLKIFFCLLFNKWRFSFQKPVAKLSPCKQNQMGFLIFLYLKILIGMKKKQNLKNFFPIMWQIAAYTKCLSRCPKFVNESLLALSIPKIKCAKLSNIFTLRWHLKLCLNKCVPYAD